MYAVALPCSDGKLTACISSKRPSMDIIAIKHEMQQMIDKCVFNLLETSSSLQSNSKVHMIIAVSPLGALRYPDGIWLQGETLKTDPCMIQSTRPPCRSIAAQKARKVSVADVTSAYLNAPMGDVVVVMCISKDIADLLVNIAPTQKRYQNNDGSIIVNLTNAVSSPPSFGISSSLRRQPDILCR